MSTLSCHSVADLKSSTNRCVVALDRSFSKTIEQFGFIENDFETPSAFSTCQIHLAVLEPDSLRLEDILVGHSVDGNQGSVRLGQGCSHSDIVLENCLRTMKRGEQCVLCFRIPVAMSEHGGTAGPSAERTEKEGTQVRMSLSLTDFSYREGSGAQGGDVWTMTSNELLAAALDLNRKGVRLYSNVDMDKDCGYRLAFVLFARAVKLLIASGGGGSDDEDSDRRRTFRATLSSCYSNLAACQLRGGKYEHAVANCNGALEWWSEEGSEGTSRVKALYRRAVAYTALREYELAARDLDTVLEVEPRNVAALRQRKVVWDATKAHTESLRVAMRKMFQ